MDIFKIIILGNKAFVPLDTWNLLVAKMMPTNRSLFTTAVSWFCAGVTEKMKCAGWDQLELIDPPSGQCSTGSQTFYLTLLDSLGSAPKLSTFIQLLSHQMKTWELHQAQVTEPKHLVAEWLKPQLSYQGFLHAVPLVDFL